MTAGHTTQIRRPSVLALGVVSADYYIRVQSLPRQDEKVNGSRLGWFAGGMCANFAVAARQLGARARFVTVFGDDGESEQMRRDLQRLEVETDGSTMVAGTPCWSSITMMDDAAEKVLVILESDLPLPDPEHSAIQAASGDWDVVYPVALNARWCTQIGRAARRTGALVTYDLEPYFMKAVWGSEDFAMMMRTADLLFLKLDSAQAAGFATSAAAAEALQAMGAKVVVVTDGPRETYCAAGDERLMVSPPTVEVVDSTGAGDAFAGTFCTLYAQQKSVAECLSTATAVGTLSVTGLGCQAYAPIVRETLDSLRLRVKVWSD